MQDAKRDLHEHVEELGCKLGEELLKPTRIYVKSLLSALKQYEIKGMAHITGGGFIENIPRMLPGNLGVEITKGSWPVLPIFKLLQQEGNLVEAEAAVKHFEELGEKAYEIGKVTAEQGVHWGN